MDNFFFGLQAVLSGAVELLRSVADYPLFWGFALGFFISTLIHGFLLTEHPSDLSSMLFHNHEKGYAKVSDAKRKHTYPHSFEQYVQQSNQLKSVFALAGIIIAFLLLLVLLSR